MSNYNTVVQYYRVNANNTALATSNSGTGTTSPTEEILAPVSGGTYSTTSTGVTITGEAGSDFSAFAVNQYLYYTDGSGNYNLMGQIASIDPGFLDLDLYAAPVGTTPTAGDTLSASYALITNIEPIYMRIATEVGVPVNTVTLPNFSSWRSSSNVVTGTNNIAVTKLERVSNVGVPVSVASPTQNIPFTIQTMNQFTPTTAGGGTYFPSTASFPSYVWIRITPSLSTTNNSLSSKTMYRITTQEYILGLNTGVNVTLAALQAAGYNITGSVSGGQTQGGQQ